MPVEHSRPQAKAAGPSPTDPRGQPEQLLLMEQFEAIFKHSFDGIWICDGRGKVLRVNPASEKMNQIKAKEIVGQHIALLEKRGIVDRSVTLEAIEKRAPVTLMQKNLKTGRRCLVTATPIFDEKGDLVLVVSNDRDLTELDNLRRRLLESEARSQRFEHELKKRELDEWEGMEIVCHSQQLHQVLDAARNAASFDTTVLITGESGTGKGLLAKFVHMLSSRREGPFVRVDCGSLPESLLESELFGYVKGAFTGARESGKLGLLEVAQGGTLFLDEIFYIPLHIQPKLLRFLENGEIVRVGSTDTVQVDARIIAASNVDLEEEVAAGRFRRDLFYRLNVIPLHLPPLRERPEDIPFLIRHFLGLFNRKFKTDKTFSVPVIEALISHDWEGNIRELENVVERLLVMSPQSTVELNDLPAAFLNKGDMSVALGQGKGLKKAVSEYEKAMINLALKMYGSQARAASVLKVSQSTIARKLNK